MDIRRNQEDLAVPVLLNSDGKDPGLDDRFESRFEERSVHAGRSFILLSGVVISAASPPLSLFAEDSGLARELRFRSREVGADVLYGSGEGVEGSVNSD